MSVYLTAATSTVAKTLSKQAALMLDQTVELPYFRAFERPLMSLPELYRLIETQIEQTLLKAGWSLNELNNVPILLGSTAYVIADCEYRKANGQPLPTQHSLSVIADYLQMRYGTQVFSFATSCTSSAQAVAYAAKMLENGLYNKALVIGFEMFNRLTFEHFHAMNLLSQAESYTPFSAPNGIVLGEGIACLALENQANSGTSCELLGIRGLTDKQNLTNNSEDALRELIDRILSHAGLSAKQICAVKVHAVGGNSDEMEIRVLREMLPYSTWILAKPFVGHTLGASGAIETAFLFNAFEQGELPALNWQPHNEALPLAQYNPLTEGYYLNYFLGFGGSSAGWILKPQKIKNG